MIPAAVSDAVKNVDAEAWIDCDETSPSRRWHDLAVLSLRKLLLLPSTHRSRERYLLRECCVLGQPRRPERPYFKGATRAMRGVGTGIASLTRSSPAISSSGSLLTSAPDGVMAQFPEVVVHASSLSSFMFLHIAVVEVIFQERGPTSLMLVEDYHLFSWRRETWGLEQHGWRWFDRLSSSPQRRCPSGCGGGRLRGRL